MNIIAIISMGYDCKYELRDMFGELEYYAFYFGLASLVFTIYTDKLTITTDKRKAYLIITEIASSLNWACFLMYFIFNPIIFGKSYIDKMDFFSASAIFLSFASLIINFMISDFVLLQQDWLFPGVFVLVWIIANLTLDLNGITVEMKKSEGV